jgi:2-isopropylmalate synthase
MERERVTIYDTSLRDGLRNSGVTMTVEQKLRFARQLEQLNVDAIEVGYGGPSQIEIMRTLAEAISDPVVYGLARVNIKDVERVLESVERAKAPGVNIFSPTSNEFLKKAKKTWQQAIDSTAAAVAYAKQHVDHIMFSAQDASRADPVLLVRICNAAIEAGATTISIADSVSYAVPSRHRRRRRQHFTTAYRERPWRPARRLQDCHDRSRRGAFSRRKSIGERSSRIEAIMNDSDNLSFSNRGGGK